MTMLAENDVRHDSEVSPSRPAGRVAIGVMLVVVGGLWMADRLEWFDVKAELVLPLLVLAVGVALVALSFEGDHPGLVVLGVVLALFTLLTSIAPTEGFRGGIGDRTHNIGSVLELESPYRLGIGSMTLDLRDLAVEGIVDVEADVGLGELIVRVPEGVAVDVEARSGAGEVSVFGQRSDGVDVDRTFTTPGDASDRLVIDVGVFMGQVEVRR